MSINQYCDRCGEPITPGARFCGRCGAATEFSEPPVQPPRANSNKGAIMAVIGGSVAGLLVLALLGFVVWPRLSGGDKVASVAPPTATTVQGVAESRQPASSLAVTPSKAAAPQATGVPTQAASPTVAPSASASEPIATQPSATPTPARSTPTPANSSPGAGEHSETGLDLPAPVSYLPRPGLQLELHEVFPSGEEADVELIAGKIADPVQVTVLRVTLEDGVVVNQFTSTSSPNKTASTPSQTTTRRPPINCWGAI